MNITEQHIRRQLVTSLSKLLETGVEQLGEAEVAGILRDLAIELDGQGGGRVCRFSDEGSGPTLTLYYEAATALEKELDILTEVCGLMVDPDSSPPLMESLDVVIMGEGSNVSVTLAGRAVHQSDAGVALELTAPDDGQKKELAMLVEKMKTRPKKSPKKEDHSPPVASEEADKPQSADSTPAVEANSQNKAPSAAQPAVEANPNPDPSPQSPSPGPSSSTLEGVSEPTMREPPRTMEWHPGNMRIKRQGLIERGEQAARKWNPADVGLGTILLESMSIDGYAVLEFNAEHNVKQLVLHFGNLVGLRMDPPAGSRPLLEYLRSSGLVESQEIRRAQQLATKSGGSLEDALIDLQAIDHAALVEAAECTLIDQLHDLWGFRGDQVCLYPLEHRPYLEIRCSISLTKEVVRHLQRRIGALSREELQEKEEYFSGKKIALSPDLDVAFEEMGLKAKELRFTEILGEKPRTLFELERVANLHQSEMMGMLLLLDELDCFIFHQPRQRSPERRRLQALRDQVDRSDNHFDLFGLHWSAYDEEVETKYRELSARFDVSPEIEEEMNDEIEALRARLDAAYAVLSNSRSRQAHRKQHIDEYSRRNAAQMYENKVESLQMRSDKSDLLDALKRYLELKPDDKQAQKMAAALEHKAAAGRG